MRRIAILGAGGMGTALALLLRKSRAEVWLWSRDAGFAAEFARTRVNERHLPGITVPESVRITSDAAGAAELAGLIVAAVPTSFLRATLAGHRAVICPRAAPVLSVVKGIEYGTFARPSQIIEEDTGPATDRRAERAEPRRGAGARAARFGGRLRHVERAERTGPRTCSATRPSASTPAPTPLGVELAGALKNIVGDRRGDLRRPGFRR